MRRFTFLQCKRRALLLTAILLNVVELFAQGFSQQTQNKLQQVLQSFQNDPSFVGGISAAIKVDGLAFWQGATGYAARNVDGQNNLLPGGTAFTTSTLSRIFSVTKTFTSALVLELVKEGKFGMNDPVSKFLPLGAINPGLNSSVTVRQLLAHESGYSDYEYEEPQFLIAVAFQPTHIWTPFEVVSFVHQLAAPGSIRRYCSTNYLMLGAIIEAATGKPVEQYYREKFFDRLDLNSMYLSIREPQPAGTVLASPHENIYQFNPIFQFTGQPTFPNAYTNIYRFPYDGIASAAFTAGGIVSNVADVAEWGNALFNGRATSQATLDSMLNSISSTPDAQGDYLGYGIWKSSKMSATETFLGHDGNAPGYRSVMFYQPDKKLTIAVLTNYHGADIYAIAKTLYAALPQFTCGNENREDTKVKVCFNGKAICVDRHAADGFINKGAYLGDCEISNANMMERQTSPGDLKTGLFIGFPNPSPGRVQFSFVADVTGPMSLQLYDVNGKLVSTMFKGNLQKGTLQLINFDKGKLPAGVYIGALKSATGLKQQKIVLTN
jgi:CubicO group peptidase (beta-lactamase class C family)